MPFNIDITKDRLYLRGYREGYEEGYREGRLISAVNLLNQGTSMEMVIQLSGFSKEEIMVMRDKMAS